MSGILDDNKNHFFECFKKELDIIQGIINRMASNSFLIKGWTLTLVVGTLLLKTKGVQMFIAFIPLIAFWCLDAYFLRQERLYRALYNWVIIERQKNSGDKLFNMSAQTRFKNKKNWYIKALFSKTLGLFYGAIIILCLGYYLITKYVAIGGSPNTQP